MDVVYIVLWVFAALWAAVLIHEAGHYLVGLLVGVPPKAMAIRLERPPYIALRDGDDWRAPDDPE